MENYKWKKNRIKWEIQTSGYSPNPKRIEGWYDNHKMHIYQAISYITTKAKKYPEPKPISVKLFTPHRAQTLKPTLANLQSNQMAQDRTKPKFGKHQHDVVGKQQLIHTGSISINETQSKTLWYSTGSHSPDFRFSGTSTRDLVRFVLKDLLLMDLMNASGILENLGVSTGVFFSAGKKKFLTANILIFCQSKCKNTLDVQSQQYNGTRIRVKHNLFKNGTLGSTLNISQFYTHL